MSLILHSGVKVPNRVGEEPQITNLKNPVLTSCKTFKTDQMRMLSKNFALACFALLILTSCGGGGEKSASASVTPEKAAPAATGEVIKVVVNSSDQMQYDTDEIKVKAGSQVELTLNHTGTFPKESMGHNLVILKAGVDLSDFSMRAMGANDTDYVPEGDETIAATKVIGGGESTTITFDAPAAGTYEFVCTIPGHFAVMQGKFIVE